MIRELALSGATGLAALASTPAQAGPPYPASTVITGVRWETSTYRWSGSGGDIWPVTWAADGTLLTAWGDGEIGCREKVSYGVAAIGAGDPSTALQLLHCGPARINRGKIMALVATPGSLWAAMASQPLASFRGFPVWRSTNGGRTWTASGTPLSFMPDSFVQFGRGNAGAPGGYVYLLDSGGTTTWLIRAPASSVANPATHEYFSGTATAPAWSRSRSVARSIFTDPAGVWRPSITYVPGLRRYLLAAAHAPSKLPSSNRQGLFEAPNLWGPWRTVYYSDSFLGMRGGFYLGMHFPSKWQAADGRTLWATFSCHNATAPGSCGIYHDRFNVMKVTLTLGASR
jgi:hypothetical protein